MKTTPGPAVARFIPFLALTAGASPALAQATFTGLNAADFACFLNRFGAGCP
jgi:hypothetical protein